MWGLWSSPKPDEVAEKPKGKDHRQVVRAKQLFKYKQQNFSNIYGQSLNRQSVHNPPLILGLEGSDELSEEQKRILMDGKRPVSIPGETRADEQRRLSQLLRESSCERVTRYPATFGRYSPAAGAYVLPNRPSPRNAKSTSPKSAAGKERVKEEVKEEPVSPPEPPPPPPPPPPPSGKPSVYELLTNKQTLSEELRVAQVTVEEIEQIISKNAQLREERCEMVAMKDTLHAAMRSFAKMKESLVSNHKDLEQKCKDIVGTEAKLEKERVRKNIAALQDMMNTMAGEQKRLRLGFQSHFKELSGEFQCIRDEMEANDNLLQERQQQFKEYQVLAQKFNTLVQKIHDMEEKLKATRAKFQKVQNSLASNQKALADTTEEKEKLERERDSTKAEWISQEQVWGTEKHAMAEDFRKQIGTKDRDWMKEREDLYTEKRLTTENLYAAQNKSEDLDDELALTKTAMQDEKRKLKEAEKNLDKYAAENAKLRDESAEKDETLDKYRNTMRAKDAEIHELKNDVERLHSELEKHADQKKKKFTLGGVIRKALDEIM